MIRIDHDWCAVFRDDVDAKLGPMEFAVVAVLSSKPGIHSSREIVERCHPRQDTNGWTDEAVRFWTKTMVMRIRRKVGTGAILNKHGFGYALAPGELE